MSLDPDALQARRATTHHDHDDDSVSVPMLPIHEEHDNPFQRRPQPSSSSHHQSSGHYNVMIPTVEHWPALFVQGVKATALFASEKLRQFQEYQQGRRRQSSAKYEGLPTSSTSSSSSSSSQRTTFTFASKRMLKESGGRTMLCSGRRLTRILLLLCIAVLIPLWIFVVPHSLKPYGDRDVWIRYFDHEEPIKIQVPLGKTVHVANVKHVAFQQLNQGFSRQRLEEGKVLMIQENEGKLRAGAPWVNTDWSFRSSSDMPILMLDPKDYELFRFLDENLRCFSSNTHFYNGQMEFRAPGNRWDKLATILRMILLAKHNSHRRLEVPFEYITYLRRGYSDPKQNVWERDGVYFYTQTEERRNAWVTPVWAPMQAYNDTVSPGMWNEQVVEEDVDDEQKIPPQAHEGDFL